MERSEKRSKRIKWSALAGVASSGAVACVSIFSAPIAINYFGKELYGIWVIISSFLIWAQLFDFGILNGLTNALSEAFGRDDYTSAQSYICTSFFITAIISGIGIVLWIFGSLNIPWHSFIKVNTAEQGYLLGKGICIVGCLFLATLPFQLSLRILQANQRMYIAHGINFIGYLLTLLGLIAGVHYGFDLLHLLFAMNGVTLIWQMICWYFLTKKVAWAKVSWKFVNVKSLKRVAHSSIPILILQVINIIASQMIPILLASVTSLKEVADFSILWKIYLFIFFMLANISAAYNPGFRDAYERGEIDWIKKLLKRLAMIQVCLIIIGCFPLLIAGNAIIEIWIRVPLEHPLSIFSWSVYVLCILFSVLNGTLNMLLVILDKSIFQIILALFSSIVLFIGITTAVTQFGLITIFGSIGLSALISIFFSFRALKRTLNSRAEALEVMNSVS